MKKNLHTPKTQFGYRKDRYESISSMFNEVRKHELDLAYDLIKLNHMGKNVLEVGSGTGFLTNHLINNGFNIDAIDAEFTKPAGVSNFWVHDLRNGLPKGVKSSNYDLIVSLATMHHVADPKTNTLPNILWYNFNEALTAGGFLLILDVSPRHDIQETAKWNCTNTGKFFNLVVDKYCIPEHQGVYLNRNPTKTKLIENHFTNFQHLDCPCPWIFNNKSDMTHFVKNLFNFQELNEYDIIEYLREYIGFNKTSEFLVLNWGLQAFIAQKI